MKTQLTFTIENSAVEEKTIRLTGTKYRRKGKRKPFNISKIEIIKK